MSSNFMNSVMVQKPGRNLFDLTHDVKMSGTMGKLYPTMCEPCLPGDKWNIGCDTLIRFAPLVTPVMHRMDVSMHYFFVPCRILWEGFEDYVSPPEEDSTPPAFPYLHMTDVNAQVGTLADYLGVPYGNATYAEDISAMRFAAYQCVYNEYYRDQNLIAPVNYKLINGNNTANLDLFDLRRRAWEHDYFTAALPFAQKGPAVSIPIQAFEDVNVYLNNVAGVTLDGTPADVIVGGHPSPDVPNDTLYADTSTLNSNPTTINQLRAAFKAQTFLEKDARGGTRYTETLKAHFDVTSSDARLQRPEYITGTKSPVIISEVLNTTGTDDAPQGNMAGHGVSVTQGKYGSYYCEEHGYIIGIMSVMPKTAYQQGLDKDFLKINDRYEMYWPDFANLGEQEVLKKEIYAFQGPTGLDTFGYMPRYAEYRTIPSRVAGQFRTTLADWHLGRIFGSPPSLNQAFVECDPSNRIFAVETGDNLWCHVLHKIRASRMIPKYGTPGGI